MEIASTLRGYPFIYFPIKKSINRDTPNGYSLSDVIDQAGAPRRHQFCVVAISRNLGMKTYLKHDAVPTVYAANEAPKTPEEISDRDRSQVSDNLGHF